MNPKERFQVISEIADRAIAIANNQGLTIKKIDMVMDIDFADRDCPLKLKQLSEASATDFVHDVFGIRRHLNRETKKLEDCFLPRYAA